MIYKFSAEHIGRPTAVKLVREFEAKNIEVEHADMDPVFSNQMIMLVTCDEAIATQIRDRIWEMNNGACCDMGIITEEELNAYL